MDVWILTAAREDPQPGSEKRAVIEVFAFKPALDDQRRAVRDYLDRRLGWDYGPGEASLRQEDLERSLYYWPRSLWQVQCQTLRGPEQYQTPDGFTFRRTPEGAYTDGDLTYPDFVSLAHHDDYLV